MEETTSLPESRTVLVEPAKVDMRSGMVFLLALTCSLIAAGSYLVQPILPIIGTELALGRWTGLAVTLTQVGFCLGLILIAPLGDLIENRALILFLLVGSVVALSFAGFATSASAFFIACFFIGVTSTTVQILIPMAAYLVSPESRGRVMGSITSGLLFGIMFSRPLSSFITYAFGWREMYVAVSVGVFSIAFLLFYFLPKRKPQSGPTYQGILTSLWSILSETPQLRMLALCQACLFSAFSLFWTAVPFQLVAHYGFNQRDIGIFAFVGAGGALSSFFAGRIKDMSLQRVVRVLAIVLVGATFAAMGSNHSIWLLTFAAVIIDAAVQLNHVLTQRAVVSISPTKVSRLNSLYATTLFIGGSMGSAMAMPIFSQFGWSGVAMVGLFLSIGSLLIWRCYIKNNV